MIKKLVLISLLFGVIELHSQPTFEFRRDVPVSNIEDVNLFNAWGGGLNAPQFSKMDLNGDEVEDLVIFERTSNKLKTFINQNGQYAYDPNYEFLFPDDLVGWMLLKDFNCDGKKDIFTNAQFGIRVFENVSSTGSLSWSLVEDPIFTEGSSGSINLQVNVTDIPGIDDLDGDGDLDILVYKFSTGGGIEYHKNLSIEQTGSCGLIYRRETRRWGEFDECECDVFAFGDEDCGQQRLKHAGGKTILTIDMDNDGDKEVMIGQEDCTPLYFLENEGTPDDALMRSFSTSFPSKDDRIEFFIFPAVYAEDINGDGLTDLISSTNFSFNEENGIDFKNSSWLYRNVGTNENPRYERLTTNFMQSGMIEVGENAYPTFSDLDNDGDLDMLVSNRGLVTDDGFISSIAYFENTGSFNNPSFELIDEDFLNYSNKRFFNLKIQIEDLDQDGIDDLATTRQSGVEIQMEYYRGSANGNFDLNNPLPINLDLNINDTFFFFDVNGDGNKDLLIGRENGRLDFLRNSGNLNFPEIQSGFYGIEENFIRKNLSVTVADLNLDDQSDLVTGDESGEILVYHDFQESINSPDAPKALEISIGSTSAKTQFGKRFYVTTANIFSPLTPTMIIGTTGGGLQLLSATNDDPGDGNNELSLVVFPNPSSNGRVLIFSSSTGSATIYNTLGQPVSTQFALAENETTIVETTTLPPGNYILKVFTPQGETSRNIVVY